MDTILYKITCLTNLHVGNGESNFDIIDNAVEKDPVTGLPTINSSGVKGALRQYFVDNKADTDTIRAVFGSDQKSTQAGRSIPGRVKIYQADMLARPARASKGDKTNYMVTSEEAIGLYNSRTEVFGGSMIIIDSKSDNTIGVEGIETFGVQDISLIGAKTVILSDSDLRELPLPVLARNQLEDGISRNLWYEQIVPHKSIFTFAVSSDDRGALKAFADNMRNNDRPAYIQFGGNASIGYGLCAVEKIGGSI